MATHSSILAWRIPWVEEPGGLQPMGLQRVGHDWVTHTRNAYYCQWFARQLCVGSENIWLHGSPASSFRTHCSLHSALRADRLSLVPTIVCPILLSCRCPGFCTTPFSLVSLSTCRAAFCSLAPPVMGVKEGEMQFYWTGFFPEALGGDVLVEEGGEGLHQWR